MHIVVLEYEQVIRYLNYWCSYVLRIDHGKQYIDTLPFTFVIVNVILLKNVVSRKPISNQFPDSLGQALLR